MARSSRIVRPRGDDSTPLAELRAALWFGSGSEQPIEALRQCGLATKALRLLRRALSDSRPRTRAEACLALDYLGDAAATADLRPMLGDPDIMVCVRAADALCSFGEPATALVPRLTEILRHGEAEFPLGNDRIRPPCMMLLMPEGRYHAARVLRYLGVEAAPAREELRAAMESCSAAVRAEAAKALAGIGEAPKVYLVPLRQALHDVKVQSSRERVWAAEALIELGEPPESVVAVVTELVCDKDWAAALLAIDFLGKVGPAAACAVPVLQAAKASGRDGIAKAAATTLQRLDVCDKC